LGNESFFSAPQLKRDPLGGCDLTAYGGPLDPVLLFLAWGAFIGGGTLYVRRAQIVTEKRRRFRLYAHVSFGVFVLVLALNLPALFVLLLLPGLVAMDLLTIRSARFCDRVGHVVIEVPWRPPILRCPECGAPVH